MKKILSLVLLVLGLVSFIPAQAQFRYGQQRVLISPH